MRKSVGIPVLAKRIWGFITRSSIQSVPGDSNQPISAAWASEHIEELNDFLTEVATLLKRITEELDEVEYDDLPIISELFEAMDSENILEEDIF